MTDRYRVVAKGKMLYDGYSRSDAHLVYDAHMGQGYDVFMYLNGVVRCSYNPTGVEPMNFDPRTDKIPTAECPREHPTRNYNLLRLTDAPGTLLVGYWEDEITFKTLARCSHRAAADTLIGLLVAGEIRL
jgi:hypothetical protein